MVKIKGKMTTELPSREDYPEDARFFLVNEWPHFKSEGKWFKIGKENKAVPVPDVWEEDANTWTASFDEILGEMKVAHSAPRASR